MTGKVSLLIVDDSEDNLLVLVSLIKEYFPEIEIFKATNAVDAMRIVEVQQVDCALVDVQMPKIDGLELCRMIKSSDRHNQAAIVLITAHRSTPELRARGLEAGADDFIHRPFDNLEFVARIKVMLRIRHAENELLATNEHLEERVQSEINRRLESEEKYRVMVELLPQLVFECDTRGLITFANNAGFRAFGYTRQDFDKGLYTPQLIAEHDRERVLENMGKLLHGSQEESFEYTALRKDGSEFTIVSYTAPILHDGETVGLRGIVVDISERKQAEEEKAKLTGQILNAQKIESIGQLAGGIAHDFNNILAGLYGNVSLAKAKLIKSLPDHPGYRHLEAAEKSMNRATALTNQLLTFSKGGVPIKETLNLSHLIEEVVPFNLSGSNVKPVVSQPDNLWLAFIDQGQIQQVIGNLTINAKQAMPSGGELLITLENAEILDNQRLGLDEGKYIRITLADNGTGISPEHLERIFEPYFTTKHTGSGLGLATAYSVTKKHDGHISVTSQLGQGTTFTLYLPAAKDQRLPPVSTVSVTAPVQQAARVLVMDDEEMICDVVKAMLEDAGHTVEAVPDGTLALERYRQALETDKPFDLVILDLTIPGGMGGKEVVKQILALHPLAKVIVSSGYADDPLMAHYVDYGFKAVVPKPFELTVLVNTVKEVLMSDSV